MVSKINKDKTRTDKMSKADNECPWCGKNVVMINGSSLICSMCDLVYRLILDSDGKYRWFRDDTSR